MSALSGLGAGTGTSTPRPFSLARFNRPSKAPERPVSISCWRIRSATLASTACWSSNCRDVMRSTLGTQGGNPVLVFVFHSGLLDKGGHNQIIAECEIGRRSKISDHEHGENRANRGQQSGMDLEFPNLAIGRNDDFTWLFSAELTIFTCLTHTRMLIHGIMLVGSATGPSSQWNSHYRGLWLTKPSQAVRKPAGRAEHIPVLISCR